MIRLAQLTTIVVLPPAWPNQRRAVRRGVPAPAAQPRSENRDALLHSVVALGTAWRDRTAAGELTSSKGLSLTYPQEWKEPTKEQLEKAAEASKKVAARSGVGEIPRPGAVIFGPPSDGFAPNVNVIVVPAKLVLDARIEKALVDGIKAKYTALAGGKAPEFKIGHKTIDGKSALTMACEYKEPASGKTLRQWGVYLPGKNQMYVVTCTSLNTQWADAFPVFNSIIKSMKVDLEEKPAGGGDATHKKSR